MTKQFVVFLAVLFSLSLVNANENQHLISYELAFTKTKADLEKKWKEAGIPKIIAPVEYGVNAYEIIYNTTYHDGSKIKASGIYFVPIEKKEDLPKVVYFHGTQIRKERSIKISGEMAICTGLATDGYAALYVDYMGIGKGEGFHIYQHIETQARAGVDLLRAVEELNKKLGYTFNDFLFTTGYSQGGHGAMSFHRFVEENPDLGLKITASSPMSGAYDMAGAQEKAMLEPYSHPGYLPYLIAGYNQVYNMYDDLSMVIKSPYDTLLLPLLDGNHSMGDLNKLMPKIPADFIEDEFREDYFANEDHPFKKALRDNSFLDWKPYAPIQLCYCKGDEQVYYENSANTYTAMKKLGAKNVRKREAGRKFGHNTCALYASLYTKMFFDSIAKKGKLKGKKGPAFKRLLVSVSKIRMRRDVRKKKQEGKYSERHKE